MPNVFNNAFPGDTDYPAATDVRSGVTYNFGASTGSVVIPTESDVRLGTAYDVAPNAKTGNVREPLTSQVQLGVVYGTNDTLTGTYVTPTAGYPSEADVREGVIFGGTSQYTGQLDLPGVDDVRLGVVFDTSQKTGTVRVPPVGKVEAGYAYDANDILTGTLTVGGGYPTATDVRLGTTYGAANEFTGTLNLPSVNKVRAGVSFDNGTKIGNSVMPPEAQVLLDTGYGSAGTEFTGTLSPNTGDCDYPSVDDVEFGVIYANGTLTGRFVAPNENDVRSGVTYGANAEFIGTWTGSSGAPTDRGWVG